MMVARCAAVAMLVAVALAIGSAGCQEDRNTSAKKRLWDLWSGKAEADMVEAPVLAGSPYPAERVLAAEIVRMRRDPAGVPLLIQLLLTDRHVDVVSSAAGALRGFDDPRLAAAAVGRLDEMSRDRLYALCHALGAKSDRASMELLQLLAVHEDRGVRGRAYRSLATFADKSKAVSALTALLPGAAVLDTALVLDVLVAIDAGRAEKAARGLLGGGVALSVEQREVAEWAIGRLEAMRNGSPDPGSCEERFAPAPLSVGSFEL